MIIKNVKVYTEEQRFSEGEVFIKNGIFVMEKDLHAEREEEIIDGEGCYAIPGMIDIHMHGCKGYDFCDGTKEAIEEITKYEASIGVTAIAPATMTLPVEELEHILSVAASYKKEVEASGGYEKGPERAAVARADLIGINMEGPFISRAKKGAQDERNIISCDAEICQRFLDAGEGLVKFVGLAPEENENAVSFIRQMKEKVRISLAHTNADYDTADAAFEAGASHAVHLYNAMPAFTHRAPGVIGAVADHEQVDAELICDGVHIHPATVRATFKMLGAERIVFISDSMRAAGMPDGCYTLGGLDVNVVGHRANLVSDGTIAGSAASLPYCLKTAVQKMGIPLETAVACVTVNPAKSVGEYENYGSITPGKKANVVLLDQDLNVKMVIKDGKRI